MFVLKLSNHGFIVLLSRILMAENQIQTVSEDDTNETQIKKFLEPAMFCHLAVLI